MSEDTWYNVRMKSIFEKISDPKHEPASVVSELYQVSLKSLPVAMVLVVLSTVFLYHELGMLIVTWSIVVFFFLTYRLYNTYWFFKDPDRQTLQVWYDKFVFAALVTAVIFGFFSILFIPHLEPFGQMFAVAVVLGMSFGASTSLHLNYRLALLYISIIVIPAIVTLFMFAHSLIFYIVPVLLILYFLAQLMLITTLHEQQVQIDTLEKDHTVLHNLFRDSPLSMFSFNKKLELTDSNKQFNILFGDESKKMIGMSLHRIADDRSVEVIKRSLEEGSQHYEGAYKAINGRDFWIEANIFPFKDSHDEVVGAIGIIEDKTKERDALVELEHISVHDPLTELLNRRGFENYMKELINEKNHHTHYSLLFYLDLNQFKGINDSLGHKIGDEVLLSVSQRLTYTMQDACSISRLGGDEFIVVFPHFTREKPEAENHAKIYGRQIQAIFDDPFIINDLHLHLRSSIGIIIIEPEYSNIEEIIRHADITMYQAKNTNNHVSYYDEALDEKQKELFVLQHDLAYAAENGQLDMFFQPIVRMYDDRLLSAEALIRWEHPQRGMMNPSEFIPLAIKAGLLSNITWWIIERVCKVIRRWKEEGVWHLNYVSININAQQLVEQNFAKEFLHTLKKHGIETSEVMIEITERSLIDSFDSTQNVINSLRDHGIKCAIDDFGIGYSSLSYLKRLSFHTLKIDKAFIKDIIGNPEELTLVKTILDIGRQFKYNIIIEGIEELKQKEVLLALDNDLSYQGFYFSKPLHPDTFHEKLLSSSQSDSSGR
jgi:diguanylate cyclase (GGDEF)-like protein/PAS domain S-box-containing protein